MFELNKKQNPINIETNKNILFKPNIIQIINLILLSSSTNPYL